MKDRRRKTHRNRSSGFLFSAVIAVLGAFPVSGITARDNMFANSGFELGRDGWQFSKTRGTECRYTVDEKEAVDGRYSALVTIEKVQGWGAQFGQVLPPGRKGKTYTFSVFVKSLGKPFPAALQIERNARPWDRVMKPLRIQVTKQWREYHVTFTVRKDFPEGWFAYISCEQPGVRFRADVFRLCEGGYTPYRDLRKEEEQTAGVAIFDIRTPGDNPLSAAEFRQRSGWRRVPEKGTSWNLSRAVFMNDRVACVLRRNTPGVELYTLRPGAPKLRAVFRPSLRAEGGAKPPAIISWQIFENTPERAVLGVVFGTSTHGARVLYCALEMGQVFVRTWTPAVDLGLRVEAPCRFMVLPDFFADDIVIDARELPVARAELPADNLFLHLLPDRGAAVAVVSKTPEEDVRITLDGKGGNRLIRSSEVSYGKGGSVWIAVMAATGIWHMRDVRPEDRNKIVPLQWKAPFPAQWRVDWRREDGLHDSWEMLVARPDGAYSKYRVFGNPGTIPADRKRWTTVLGTFRYPCWFDRKWRGFLQPLDHPALRFRGAAVIYPINRIRETGLDTFTVVDVVRGTLGVGPCEYVLDVEGQQSQYRGRATCAVRDTLNPIYAKGLQNKKRSEIEQVLRDLLAFVRHIRGRIETYRAFGHEMLAYLARQKKAHPELAEPITELEDLTRVIDAKIAARRAKIATPAKVAEMADEFRKTVLGYTGPDALRRCKRFTAAWVVIGGNQDELAGECRWAVKVLRQRAALIMARDPRMRDIADEIRRRTRKVLRNPANHEGARH